MSATSLTPPRYHEIVSNLGWREALLLVAVALATNLVYNAYLHPLRKIPGPFLAGITELWRTNKYASGQWHQDIVDLHRRYGPVVRVSPNEVSFVDQAALEQVYGHATGTRKVTSSAELTDPLSQYKLTLICRLGGTILGHSRGAAPVYVYWPSPLLASCLSTSETLQLLGKF